MIKKYIRFFVILIIALIIAASLNCLNIKINNDKIDECLNNGGQAVMKDKIYMERCIEKKYCNFDPLAKYN